MKPIFSLSPPLPFGWSFQGTLLLHNGKYAGNIFEDENEDVVFQTVKHEPEIISYGERIGARVMRRFYFNTGVKPWNTSAKDAEFNDRNEMMIPFYCEDVPENASFFFASMYSDLHKHDRSCIVRKIYHSGPSFISDWAYFKIQKQP